MISTITHAEIDDRLSRKWGTGDKLVAAAWTVEAFAASIGIFIAILTIYGAREEAARAGLATTIEDNLNAILGGLPFFMVAVVELCKIPLATAYFHAGTRIWRLIFLGGLFLLLGITFLTMMNGFERFLATRNVVITEARDVARSIKNEISTTGEEKNSLLALTEELIRKEYDGANKQVNENLDTEIKGVEGEHRGLLADGPVDKTILQNQRSDIEKELTALDQQRNKDIEEAEKNYERNREQNDRATKEERDSKQKRLNQIEESIAELRRDEAKELDATIFIFRGSVEEKHLKERNRLQAEAEELRSSIASFSLARTTTDLVGIKDKDNARKSIDDSRKERRNVLIEKRNKIDETASADSRKTASNLKPQQDALESRRKTINSKYESQLNQARKRFEDRLSDLKTREARVQELDARSVDLKKKLQEQKVVIAKETNKNQIYRVAKWITGKDDADEITQVELSITTFLWFGSLAAITAWTGTLIAFGGLVLKYKHSFPEKPTSGKAGSFHKLITSLRILIVGIRKWVREPKIKYVEKVVIKTVEVIKEVAVNKIVYQEIPREVVRKELVYVPMFTNDPELLKTEYPPKPATVKVVE